jgi:hypothetical protein
MVYHNNNGLAGIDFKVRLMAGPADMFEYRCGGSVDSRQRKAVENQWLAKPALSPPIDVEFSALCAEQGEELWIRT